MLKLPDPPPTTFSFVPTLPWSAFRPIEKKRIAVGFVLHVMQVAGAEVLVAQTIRKLRDEISATVFCLDGIGTIGEQLQEEGIPVVCLNRRPGRDLGVAGRLAGMIREREISVVHAHQYTPFFYAALAKAVSRRKFKLILTEHGRHFPDVVSPLRRVVNRLLLDRFADEINACCGFSAEALSRVDGFSGRRIEVIENGIDVSRYGVGNREELRQKFDLKPERKYLAMVARFHPVKDHAMLLKGFAEVVHTREDVDLLLVGDGPLRADLEALCDSLGIRERVRFMGIRRDVPEILRAVDFFALTSVSEAASLTLLEAMASELPVVVTDVGGNPEIVREGIDGFRVGRGDSAACANALRKILNDADLARKLGQSGRQRVESFYSLDRTIQRYADLYRRKG